MRPKLPQLGKKYERISKMCWAVKWLSQKHAHGWLSNAPSLSDVCTIHVTHTTETYHKYEQSINDNDGSSWSKEQLSEPPEITILDQCGPVGNVVLCSYFASDGLCATQSPAARYVGNRIFENGVPFQSGALSFSTHTHAHTRILFSSS